MSRGIAGCLPRGTAAPPAEDHGPNWPVLDPATRTLREPYHDLVQAGGPPDGPDAPDQTTRCRHLVLPLQEHTTFVRSFMMPAAARTTKLSS
jgi:hypothetical protein